MELEVLPNQSAETEVGNYFVANYPPFSAWTADQVPDAMRMLASKPEGDVPPLGLYMHIPFCRKRCRFCYFRVYTDKNSSQIEEYLAGLTREIALCAQQPQIAGRDLAFAYFGGGTPSYLSVDQLHGLIDRVREHFTWDKAREVTFECEPGTLKKNKLEAIRDIGTTRLSLGIEHFDDDILEINGRAHKSPEVYRAYDWAREVGFRQINVDLIAGMVGDTEGTWIETVDKALALEPDSLTVYQMEVPHNTVLARESMEGDAHPVADWETKRRWVDYAFRTFEQAGYQISSAYTVVRPGPDAGFVYRDALWRGADMAGTGVASFSYVGGMHYQNADGWDDYLQTLADGQMPIRRALKNEPRQLLIRELILQLKLGSIDAGYFRGKFGVEITELFADAWARLESAGLVVMNGDSVRLMRAGLLRVDALLPLFFEPQFRGARYT